MSNHIFDAALELQIFCERQKWKFCFIGGVALQQFKARISDAREFALRNRVLLVQSSAGVPLDVALASTLFEQSSVKRTTPFTYKSRHTLMTCSAEDLIVHKAFADRLKDWGDIEVVLMKQHGKLNFKQIWRDLLPLIALKEQPEIEGKLRKLIDKVDRLAQ